MFCEVTNCFTMKHLDIQYHFTKLVLTAYGAYFTVVCVLNEFSFFKIYITLLQWPKILVI